MGPIVRACVLASILLTCVRDVHAASVSELSWLAGCWAAEGMEAGSEEHWLAPAGGTMIGSNRSVADGRTVAHEFMQIHETAPETLVFVASPSGQPETTFALLRLAENEVVFENPDHDFPQRIVYRREGDRLMARIEGRSGGETRIVEFPMRRVDCAGEGDTSLDPERLLGTWRVDLRPTPDAEPYYQELVVTSVSGDAIEGTFYGTEIENGRINRDWGRLHFGFTTKDGTGPYNTSAALVGDRIEGTTHSLGRGFLAVWGAERVE